MFDILTLLLITLSKMDLSKIFPNLEFFDIIVITGILATGIILGAIVQMYLVRRFVKFTANTAGKSDDKIVKAIGNTPFMYIMLTAIYFSSLTIEIQGGVQDAFEKVVIVSYIFISTMLLSRITGVMVDVFLISQGNESASLFRNASRILVYILGFLIISQTLGIDITAALTALGVGGLAVALALQDTLSNLFAGFYIIAARKIKPGDYVELDSGEKGYIQDISWRNTTINTLQNYTIIIPNATISNVILTNYDLPIQDLAILQEVGVAYGSDLDKVEKVTIAVAKEVMEQVEGGMPNFDPFVRFHTFGDSSINFTVIMRGKRYTDKFLLCHEFMKRLHKRYEKENIEFPFPQMDILIKNIKELKK